MHPLRMRSDSDVVWHICIFVPLHYNCYNWILLFIHSWCSLILYWLNVLIADDSKITLRLLLFFFSFLPRRLLILYKYTYTWLAPPTKWTPPLAMSPTHPRKWLASPTIELHRPQKARVGGAHCWLSTLHSSDANHSSSALNTDSRITPPCTVLYLD